MYLRSDSRIALCTKYNASAHSSTRPLRSSRSLRGVGETSIDPQEGAEVLGVPLFLDRRRTYEGRETGAAFLGASEMMFGIDPGRGLSRAADG
jgi:hypothetical protein